MVQLSISHLPTFMLLRAEDSSLLGNGEDSIPNFLKGTFLDCTDLEDGGSKLL